MIPGKPFLCSLFLSLLAGSLLLGWNSGHADELLDAFAPTLTRQDADGWVNSAPVQLGKLTGKVILLVNWNSGNWDSLHCMPWLRSLLEKNKGGDFMLLSVHSPEFPHEHDRVALERRIKEFNLDFPIMLDDDRAYWRSLKEPTLPAFYLLDRHGRISSIFEGAVRAGDERALAIEEALQKLLQK